MSILNNIVLVQDECIARPRSLIAVLDIKLRQGLCVYLIRYGGTVCPSHGILGSVGVTTDVCLMVLYLITTDVCLMVLYLMNDMASLSTLLFCNLFFGYFVGNNVDAILLPFCCHIDQFHEYAN